MNKIECSGQMLFTVVCAAALFVYGCGPGTGAVKVDEINEGVWGTYPITDGFRHALPKPADRVVIWGGHPAATGAAINWLQRQGLRIVERAQLRKIFDEQRTQLTHSSDDEAHVLQAGKILGANVVVFLDTPITGGNRTSGGSFAYGSVGASSLDSASVYSTSAWVRGVSIESGEVLWSATARYPESFANLDNVLAELTCHALATAWGFRKSGKPDMLPDMCMVKGVARF